jgi:hypothetical protein
MLNDLLLVDHSSVQIDVCICENMPNSPQIFKLDMALDLYVDGNWQIRITCYFGEDKGNEYRDG